MNIHLSEAAEHLRDSLGHHVWVLPLHQGDPVVRAREELVLLRKLHAGARGRLELVDYLAPLHGHAHAAARRGMLRCPDTAVWLILLPRWQKWFVFAADKRARCEPKYKGFFEYDYLSSFRL